MMPPVKQWLRTFGLAAVAVLAVSCGDGQERPDREAVIAGQGGHHHEPPHGGTAVTFGDEDFHVEFVPDQTRGIVEAYFFSPHMAEFLRVPLDSFSVTIVDDLQQERGFVFEAEASKATGETVGDTSMFVAKTGRLEGGSGKVLARIDEIELFGRRYEGIEFELTLP